MSKANKSTKIPKILVDIYYTINPNYVLIADQPIQPDNIEEEKQSDDINVENINTDNINTSAVPAVIQPIVKVPAQPVKQCHRFTINLHWPLSKLLKRLYVHANLSWPYSDTKTKDITHTTHNDNIDILNTEYDSTIDLNSGPMRLIRELQRSYIKISRDGITNTHMLYHYCKPDHKAPVNPNDELTLLPLKNEYGIFNCVLGNVADNTPHQQKYMLATLHIEQFIVMIQ